MSTPLRWLHQSLHCSFSGGWICCSVDSLMWLHQLLISPLRCLPPFSRPSRTACDASWQSGPRRRPSEVHRLQHNRDLAPPTLAKIASASLLAPSIHSCGCISRSSPLPDVYLPLSTCRSPIPFRSITLSHALSQFQTLSHRPDIFSRPSKYVCVVLACAFCRRCCGYQCVVHGVLRVSSQVV